MATLEQELEHLADADRDIAKAELHIAELELTARRLAETGGDTTLTHQLLATMRESVTTFREQRRLIAETIDDMRSGRRLEIEDAVALAPPGGNEPIPPATR
ncbi:hypothetical protein [Eleftheria terrae]|uniref:hypothetical protein n=1 Tax=Eleftheria terrae TaxID=1597781 RepID=UPI00263B2975|nr:hypothetical protein [Eleftheria terrae]WKB50873.1 hypothetical protein N7L95_13735 [Eleftheria terrae]